MCQPPAEEAVRAMLGPVVSPEDTVEKIRSVPSLRPQRIFEVFLSGGRTLHLVLPSLAMWRPLRSEQDVVSSEAAAVQWIRETVSQQENATTRQTQPQQQELLSSAPHSKANSNLAHSPLPLLLPTLLHQGQKSHLPDSSFAVYTPVRGTPLAFLPSPPDQPAQLAIDRQLGVLFRALASLTSPTGRFGPLAAVVTTNPNANSSSGNSSQSPRPRPSHPLAATAAPPTAGGATRGGATTPSGAAAAATAGAKLPKVLVEGGLSSTSGAGTWSVAFHSMLEGVLRDGEDMAVVMAYSTIRRQFRRLGYVLDEVGTGRLVVVDAVGRGNVLVSEEGGEEVDDEEGVGLEKRGGGGLKEGDGEAVRLEKEDGEEEGKEGEIGVGEEDKGKEVEGEAQREDSEKTTPQEEERPRKRLRLAGLRDWSSCVFGDPLLAAVFSDPQQPQPPSSAFLEGFNGEKPDLPHKSVPHRPFPLDETIIEGIDTAWIRILLYQVYHAVARIVGEFYRPRQDSSTRELEARKKLNEVLARLAEVPDDAKKRHQRPSGEMSPAKRLRGAE